MLEGQAQTAAFWWKQTLASASIWLLITCLLIRLPLNSAIAQAARSNNLSLECHWLADIGREEEKVLGFSPGGITDSHSDSLFKFHWGGQKIIGSISLYPRKNKD